MQPLSEILLGLSHTPRDHRAVSLIPIVYLPGDHYTGKFDSLPELPGAN